MNISLENMDYKIENGIGYIILNNPPANIMTEQFFEDFYNIVFHHITEDLRGIIIAGGGRHYSSGVDVDMLTAMIKSQVQLDENMNIVKLPEGHVRHKESFTRLNDMKIPVISVIRGFCIGSGFELALNSHIRICEKNAQVGCPESTFGFMPALGGCVRTTEIAGLTNSLEVVFSGKIYNSSEIDELGLIDLLVEKKAGLTMAEDLIHYIESKEKSYDYRLAYRYINNFQSEKLRTEC